MVKWLLPSGTKSRTLSTELRRGPALIAFVDARPLSIANRQISVVCAQKFYTGNCPKFHLARHDSTRSTSQAYRDKRVERVEPCCFNIVDDEQA